MSMQNTLNRLDRWYILRWVYQVVLSNLTILGLHSFCIGRQTFPVPRKLCYSSISMVVWITIWVSWYNQPFCYIINRPNKSAFSWDCVAKHSVSNGTCLLASVICLSLHFTYVPLTHSQCSNICQVFQPHQYFLSQVPGSKHWLFNHHFWWLQLFSVEGSSSYEYSANATKISKKVIYG